MILPPFRWNDFANPVSFRNGFDMYRNILDRIHVQELPYSGEKDGPVRDIIIAVVVIERRVGTVKFTSIVVTSSMIATTDLQVDLGILNGLH